MKMADFCIIGILVLIAIVDVGLLLLKLRTITSRLKSYGHRVAFVPYMLGVLPGHFYSDRGPLAGNWLVSIACLLCAGLALTGAHFGFRKLLRDMPGWFPLVYIAPGIACGFFFWPSG